MNTVAGLVARNARRRPDALAIAEVASGETMTWAEYDARSSQMAATLRAFEPGARVALQLPDGPGVHAAMLACEKAGLVAVGIGARAGEREVAHLVDRSGARTLFREPPARAGIERGAEHHIGEDDLWFLNSTSGTTGLPKIVMHTQARWFAFHDLADRVATSPRTTSSARCCRRRSASGCGPRTSHRPSPAPRVSCASASTPPSCSTRSSVTASRCSPRCRRSSS